MSESVDGSLRTEKMLNFVEIYNKNETKLTKIPYSFFFFWSSKYMKITRLAMQWNPIN